MKQYLNDGTKKVIIVKGHPRMGKTLFIKRCIQYIKQRGKADKSLYLDFRTSIGEIDNLVWFRC